MVNTRRGLARQQEQQPTPCRPTKDSPVSSDEEGIPNQTGRKQPKLGNIDLSWFDKARLRVIAAAVFGFRCLLTLEPGLTNKDLNFIHFLARTTATVILLCLECSWGLYPGHLNVNVYLNIDIMRMDLHHSFDAGIFFLLPSLIVLRKILEFSEFNASVVRTRDKRRFYEVFSDTSWTYQLYAASFDPNRSIHRRNIDTTVRIPEITRHPDQKGYTEHTYPFNQSEMQNLRSHVHPFFVTANAYLHMRKLDSKKRAQMTKDNEALGLVWKIGEIWLQTPPASFEDTKKGGENAMADPVKDTVSFLADTDSHGKIKYQKKEVFYRSLLVWADDKRSFENVFSNPSSENQKDVETVVKPAVMSPEPRRGRLRASTISRRKQSNDVVVDNIQPVQTTSKKRGRDGFALDVPAKKRMLESMSLPTSRKSRRHSTQGKRSLTPIDLEPAIHSYPSLPEIDVENGTNLLMDFISSQIAILRKDSRYSPNSDVDYSAKEIADIAFQVLDRQNSNENVAFDVVGTPKSRKESKVSSPVKDSSPIKKRSNRPRSSSFILSHVEVPRLKHHLLSQPQKIDTSPNPRRVELQPLPKKPCSTSKPEPVLTESMNSSTHETQNVSTFPQIKPSPSLSDIALKPLSKSVNKIPHSRFSTPVATTDDDVMFLRAGRQVVFESMAHEFGLSVEKVSSIYTEVGDLDRTKRILSTLSRAGSSIRDVLRSPRPSFSRGSSVKPSPTKKQKFTRSQSAVPPSSTSLPKSSNSRRAFISPSARRNRSSFHAETSVGEDESDNDADSSESDEIRESQKERKKLRASAPPSRSSSLKSKSPASRQFSQSSLQKAKKDIINGEPGRSVSSNSVPESRLDSLTRSIELILRSGR